MRPMTYALAALLIITATARGEVDPPFDIDAFVREQIAAASSPPALFDAVGGAGLLADVHEREVDHARRDARARLGVALLPIHYAHTKPGLSPDAGRAYRLERLRVWLEAAVPIDYRGPVVIDYEQHHPALANRSAPLPVTYRGIVLDFAELATEARRRRQLARTGFWNVPSRRQVSDAWRAQASVEPLTSLEATLYPDCYDHAGIGIDDGPAIADNVRRILEQHDQPVIAFVSVHGELNGRPAYLEAAEFVDNARAALRARGRAGRRVAGIALWGAYPNGGTSRADRLELARQFDALFAERLEDLAAVTLEEHQRWVGEMRGPTPAEILGASSSPAPSSAMPLKPCCDDLTELLEGDTGPHDSPTLTPATLAIIQQLAEQAAGQPIDNAAIDVAATEGAGVGYVQGFNAGLEYLRRRYCSP